MTSFNLSDWALRNKSFVVYLMLIAADRRRLGLRQARPRGGSALHHQDHGRQDAVAGRHATDTLQQVTDRIEKKLEELPYPRLRAQLHQAGRVRGVRQPEGHGRSRKAVPDLWYQVRKKIDDIRHTLPSGIDGPFFNDEFGDTYSLVYALTSDGFTHRELRDQAERLRAELLRVRDVAKVELVGVQDEKIYLEFSTQQIAALGLDVNALMQTLQAQNALVPSGDVDAGPERIAIRVSGEFTSEESLKAVNFRSDNRFFRLSDIATVKRAYADPPQPMFRFNGQSAIGLAVAMTTGGDVLALGHKSSTELPSSTRDLPVGLDMHLVADQPQVVHEAVGEFTKSLMEAIAIVLAVSFLALGWRPGIVVAVAIPLVLAITFVLMKFAGISLQRISLGALIIALGLLVDDAMIAVEMMITKMEEGYDKIKAATFAYTSTAFPMLTGTLVTIAGFVPVGFAQSGAGEYTFSLFAVVGIALIVSWLVAVLFTPLTGVFILPDKLKGHGKHGVLALSRDGSIACSISRCATASSCSLPQPDCSCCRWSACSSCSSSSSRSRTGPS